MKTAEIRRKYLDFFEKQGHVIVPSSSLVPENDATTLFTGSGMQPMLPYLLGQVHPLGKRIADSQKSFRSQDIEEVGDNRHTTFFEMLGNWSFGDYFKTEQLSWMFGFLTKEIGLDPGRIYVTCFRGNEDLGLPKDEESANIWLKLFNDAGVEAKVVDFSEKVGLLDGRIFYYDERKNWWSRSGVPANMPEGEPGGSDTEMFWDFGKHLGLHEKSSFATEPCHVNCDCGRFMEIGNNVFMEYKKTSDGFEKLSQQNVDFGGGLERLSAASIDNPDVFLIDLFDGPRELLASLSQKDYLESIELTRAFRIILDHIRAAVFLAFDGVEPSNKDRGYVMRRLIRRSIIYAHPLGLDVGWLGEVANSFIDSYEDAYPLREKRNEILRALGSEADKFSNTLAKGLKEFDKQIELKGNLTGLEAFNLYQSFGFPWELTHELAVRRGLVVDRNEFEEQFVKHQELSRSASAGDFKGGLASHSAKVVALHTATHLMHQALRNVLGEHVWQKGSNITEERTRFDFTHPQKVTPEELGRIEDMVNFWISRELVVERKVMTLEEARDLGAIGLFGEKYGEMVSVYTIIDPEDSRVVSREFCGGPHVETTKGMGHFKIIKEEAVSAGVRRIKAILELKC